VSGEMRLQVYKTAAGDNISLCSRDELFLLLMDDIEDAGIVLNRLEAAKLATILLRFARTGELPVTKKGFFKESTHAR